jgi:hypothetical protein
MSQTPSSRPPARKPSLPSFLGGRRLPGHTLVPNRSLRRMHRLLVLSLLGQALTIGLVVGAGTRAERPQGLRPPGIDLLPRGEGP